MAVRGVVGRRLIFQQFSGKAAPALAWFGSEFYADLVRPQAATDRGTGTATVVSRAGKGVSFTGAGTGKFQFTTQAERDQITIFWVGKQTAGASLARIVSGYPNRHDLYNDSSTVIFQSFRSVNQGQWYWTGWADGTLHSYAVTYDGASTANDPVGYLDGVAVAPTESSAPSGSLVAAGTSYAVGGRPDTTGRQANGTLYVALRFDRVLSPVEIRWLHANAARLAEWQWDLVPVSAGSATPITTATETDTSQAIASSQRASVGLATETDSAIAIASSQRATLGLASETDSAQALAAHQAQTIGLASETDAAQPISTGAVVSVGLASETDTAQALASNQAASVGLVSETDTAQSISVTGAGTLGTASETDTAQALVANQSATVGLASETDTAQPISRVEFITVGLASETDTAQPIVSLQRASISPALETDTAQEIGITGGEPPAPPAPTFQPGYKHNPRTARDLDPLPPIGDDLADLVRDKWDAIERANAAIKRARGGDAPAQATVPTPASAPAPRPSRRPAGAIAAAGLPLTDEQLRADEEAFILMVAEIL